MGILDTITSAIKTDVQNNLAPLNGGAPSTDPGQIASVASYGGAIPKDRLAYPPNYFVNPPLNSPAYSARADTGQYTMPGSENLFRGWLMESPTDLVLGSTTYASPSSDYTRLYRLNFHFNPSDVTMDWQVSAPQFDPPGNTTAADQSIAVYSTQGVTFGVNLLLDRVGDIHPDVVAWGGVNADIRILNAIMTSGAQPGQNTYATPSPVTCIIGRRYAQAFASRGEMLQDHVFGGAPKAYPLAVTGFMNSLSVDYQRFDKDMTPTRAVVSLSIQVLTWSPATPNYPTPITTFRNGVRRQ